MCVSLHFGDLNLSSWAYPTRTLHLWSDHHANANGVW